jgi:hypothetical protein
MSKSNRPVGIQKAKIFPTNSQTNFSFKNGNPQITFNIAPNSNLLDTKTLRLNFNLEIVKTTDTTMRPNPQNVLNNGDAKDCNMNSRVAVNSIIDTLRIRSQDTNEVIEEVRNYSRLLASVIPCLSSFGSYKNWISNKNNAYARNDVQAISVAVEVPVSLQLRSGLLNSGQPINTMASGGVVIDIMLSPDSFCLFGSNASEFFYQISDVNMTWNWIEMSSPMLPNQETFQYPAFNSYLNVVQSGDDQSSLMLALQSCRSIFSNSIPSKKINNFTFDSLETPRLQDEPTNNNFTDRAVKEYTHLRNNVKFNKQYSVDERQAVQDSVYEAHKNREFLDCIQPFRNITSLLQSPATQGTKTIVDNNLDTPDVDAYIGGVGVNYDTTASGSGVNFQNAQYALRVVSELNNTPNSLFTYALSNQALNLKNAQVQVVQ